MQPILEIQNISKKFTIGHLAQPYENIREQVGQLFRGKKEKSKETFWALKDISFKVEYGQSLGIIGKNGAGKSTLLKILSKITPPTTGKIVGRGRIASLLEVGTGFHPELTGRENVYLNGSILGMKRKEIQDKFDEIVDFSGVEKFLDTPLKHYSSGMSLRLAFAVAAFLEPEILLIDEVLAVGDAEFQKKCLGKMEDVTNHEGRTILFVSHNMGVITQLCPTTIVLDKGSLVFQGKSETAVDFYLDNSRLHAVINKEGELAIENQFVKVFNADQNRNAKTEFKYDEGIDLIVDLYLPQWNEYLELALSVYDRYKRRVFTIHEPLKKYYDGNERIKFDVKIPGKFLTPGDYSWLMCINHPGKKNYDLQNDVCGFSILETGSEFAIYRDYGCVFAPYNIEIING